MENIKNIAGFDILLNGIDAKFSDEEAAEISPRTLEEMKTFLSSNDVQSNNDPIYNVFRGLHKKGNKTAKNTLRYDLTTLAHGTFTFSNGEREFFRTAGHYHKAAHNVGWPEIYEVIAGVGRWLIQKPSQNPEDIDEAYLIEAHPGEKICIPPGFGHTMTNAEAKVLITANVIAADLLYDYGPYKQLSGACFRLLASEIPNMIEIALNTRYRRVSQVKKLRPRKDWLKGYFEPLWNIFQNQNENLQFLLHPETYKKEFFSIEKLYRGI